MFRVKFSKLWTRDLSEAGVMELYQGVRYCMRIPSIVCRFNKWFMCLTTFFSDECGFQNTVSFKSVTELFLLCIFLGGYNGKSLYLERLGTTGWAAVSGWLLCFASLPFHSISAVMELWPAEVVWILPEFNQHSPFKASNLSLNRRHGEGHLLCSWCCMMLFPPPFCMYPISFWDWQYNSVLKKNWTFIGILEQLVPHFFGFH